MSVREHERVRGRYEGTDRDKKSLAKVKYKRFYIQISPRVF